MSDHNSTGDSRTDQQKNTSQEINLQKLADELFKLLKKQLNIETERGVNDFL